MEHLFTIPILSWRLDIFHVPEMEDMGQYIGAQGSEPDAVHLRCWSKDGPTVPELQVLLHEIVHVVEANFQIEELSETHVDLISAVITAVLVEMDLVLIKPYDPTDPDFQSKPRRKDDSDDCESSDPV